MTTILPLIRKVKRSKKSNMIAKTEHYHYLLNLSYSEAVKFLLNKYGTSKDDYFKEKS